MLLKINTVIFLSNILKNKKICEFFSLGAFLKNLITIKRGIIQK